MASSSSPGIPSADHLTLRPYSERGPEPEADSIDVVFSRSNSLETVPSIEDTVIDRTGVVGGQAPGSGFLDKLYDILEEPKYQKYISWCDNGESILIKQVEEFSRLVLPKYYKHNNFQSFVRQLNMYSFSKTRHDANWREFKQPLFQRGQRHLISKIKRKASGGQVVAKGAPANTVKAELVRDTPIRPQAYEESLHDEISSMTKRIQDLETDLWLLHRRCSAIEYENQSLKRLFRGGTEHTQVLIHEDGGLKQISSDSTDSLTGPQSHHRPVVTARSRNESSSTKLDTENPKLPQSQTIKDIHTCDSKRSTQTLDDAAIKAAAELAKVACVDVSSEDDVGEGIQTLVNTFTLTQKNRTYLATHTPHPHAPIRKSVNGSLHETFTHSGLEHDGYTTLSGEPSSKKLKL